jgi:hypothetical protein
MQQEMSTNKKAPCFEATIVEVLLLAVVFTAAACSVKRTAAH